MSLRRVLLGILFCFLAVPLVTTNLVAQVAADDVPKVQLFLGYQWLHPGITVPFPFQPVDTPVGHTLGDISEGGGASVTYNFTHYLGLEGDYGANKNGGGSVNTLSIGPRLAVRTEGATFFIHTLAGWNRLNVPDVATSNGVGAILGGGMDLNVWRRLSIRVFEADWVWANHNFSGEVGPGFPDLRRPQMDESPAAHGRGLQLRLSQPGDTGRQLLDSAQRSHGRRTCNRDRDRQQFQSQAHRDLHLGEHRRKSHKQGQYGDPGHEWSCRRKLHGYCARHRSEDEERWRDQLHRYIYGERTAEESADHVLLGESDFSAGRHAFDSHLHMHQPG